MAKIKEQEIFVNPYVIQMDKFADSLQHLSKTFLNMEAYKGTLSREEIDEMFEKVTGNVCAGCERRGECLGEKHSVTYQMMYEILCAAEEYGAELNMELKRRLKRQCLFAPRFLRESLEEFENAKQILMWNHRLVQAREGYARQLTSFAKMIQYTTRELDAGIFQDDHLEKRIKAALKKENVCLFDLYQGSCEFVKAGASATFIKRKKEVEKIESTTLPIGVVQNIELDREERNLESGEYVIMVTDGVMDALPEGAQEEKIVEFIRETDIVNPTEFARGILSQVLKSSGGMPMDDMTVLVIGIWGLS